MKVNLVVAQGVHIGKVIPIATSQFLIGRDPQCNLRPSSASVSKQHCGIFVHGGKVVVRDYGSTNGTLVNGEKVEGEREVANDDKLTIGPLEFTLRIEATVPHATSVARPAAVGAKVSSDTEVMTCPPAAVICGDADDSEAAAALLMAMDDGNTPTGENQIPDGTTAMDIPAMPGAPGEAKPPAKKPEVVNSSKAAADILSKYMRRPRS